MLARWIIVAELALVILLLYQIGTGLQAAGTQAEAYAAQASQSPLGKLLSATGL